MVEVKNITKKYGDKRGITNFDFNVKKGEILGFLGPNGAGKTTTLNIISGFISPSEGSVLINGYDIKDHPLEAKKCLGYSPEFPPLYPELQVKSYLNFVSEIKGIKKEDRKNQIEEVLELVKIKDVKDRLIKNLSKGYKQRVGLAQALLSKPELLILDEPTVGLDPKQIIEMRLLIKKLGKEHTILLSSHILSEVSIICDRVIIINEGKIIAVDTPKNLSKNIMMCERFMIRVKAPKNKFIKLVKEIKGVLKVEDIISGDYCPKGFYEYIIENQDSIDVKTPLFFALAKNKYVIHELKPLHINLENVFLQLIEKNKERIREE